MITKKYILLLLASTLLLTSWKVSGQYWLTEKHPGYTLHYTSRDSMYIKDYNVLVEKGMADVKTFFDTAYKQVFDIYIHPDRHSLDSTWQKDWQMPSFTSECWMVASGIATKLDVISPKRWDNEACEHSYAEKQKTQQLITHELVHVFHGQQNISPDFSHTEGIDWFVEGLATYASGQCDTQRLETVKRAITDKAIPDNLDNFWTGKIKYGLSGSVVMYLDHTYGRSTLKKLLPFNKRPDVLATLDTTEVELLAGWKAYMINL